MSRLLGRSPMAFLACVALALAAGIAVTPAIASGGFTRFLSIHPTVVVATPVDYTGTFGSGVATLQGNNNGAGYGVVGTAGSSAGVFGDSNTGTGLVGLSTSGFGLSGSSINNIGLNGFSQNATGVGGSGPNADYPNAGVFGTTGSTSTIVSPTGVYGSVPVTGFGVIGECVNNNVGMPTSATACHGVLGQTLGTQGVAVEAFGLNTAPAANYTPDPTVAIENFSGGPEVGVYSNSGEVDQILNTGEIIVNTGTIATGIFSESSTGTGIVAFTGGSGGDAMDANTGGNAGEASLGMANGAGVDVFGFATPAPNVPSLLIDDFSGGPAIIAHSFLGGLDIFSVDDGGNLNIAGTATYGFSPLIRTRTSSGPELSTYTPQQSEPTVEDFGQGRLVNGAAYVHIDPAFASTMDKSTGYLVLITPDGDSRGLYTASKTSAGFEVRENQGGHSTLQFDYRIVAKPYLSTAARLPLARMPMHTANLSAVEAAARSHKFGMHVKTGLVLHDRPIGKPHGPIPIPHP